MLPPALQTTGRLVVIGRNPKDALVSRFFWERRGSEDDEESPEEQRRAMESTHREFLEEVAEGDIPTGAQCATHPSSHPPPPTPPSALDPPLLPPSAVGPKLPSYPWESSPNSPQFRHAAVACA